MTDPDVPIEIKDFINRVVPDNYKTGEDISERGRLLIDTEYTTPDILLKTDPLFDKYRNNAEIMNELSINSYNNLYLKQKHHTLFLVSLVLANQRCFGTFPDLSRLMLAVGPFKWAPMWFSAMAR